jgi:hypothetical protein
MEGKKRKKDQGRKGRDRVKTTNEKELSKSGVIQISGRGIHRKCT